MIALQIAMDNRNPCRRMFWLQSYFMCHSGVIAYLEMPFANLVTIKKQIRFEGIVV